jgi:hypothetical protein
MNMMLVLHESRAICPYSVGLHGGIHDDEEMGELFRVNVPSVNPKICAKYRSPE